MIKPETGTRRNAIWYNLMKKGWLSITSSTIKVEFDMKKGGHPVSEVSLKSSSAG